MIGQIIEGAASVDPEAAREARVDAAWHAIVDHSGPAAELIEHCKTMLADCRDGRRDTAADLLKILEGKG